MMMTSKVQSELGLPPERVNHDPMITAGVVVAAAIALQSPAGARVLLRVTREATEESGEAVRVVWGTVCMALRADLVWRVWPL
jgi:choline-glycine betaine transporter